MVILSYYFIVQLYMVYILHPEYQEMPFNHRKNDGVFRMFFFLGIFCLSALVVYFTLGKIWVYGNGNKTGIRKTHTSEVVGTRLTLFPRSLSSSRIESFPSSIEDDYKFVIIVFAWRRKESLERLINSLQVADYVNHEVQLNFNIDFDPSEDVKNYIESVNWQHGSKNIIQRRESYGLERMVIESWKAENDKEFAFFFEDDIEVQPDYFNFALEFVKKEGIRFNPNLIGIALNTPRYDEVNLDHSIWLPEFNIAKLFLFQQPCSWGALYFPWKWREFLTYYRKSRSNSVVEHKKVIPESCVFNWGNSWKKYLMEMMVRKGYVMLYPSLKNQASFSVHHREEGEHTGLIKQLNITSVDYFIVPFARNEEAKLLIEEVKNANLDKLPIVSFYHCPVGSIEELKLFGRLIK